MIVIFFLKKCLTGSNCQAQMFLNPIQISVSSCICKNSVIRGSAASGDYCIESWTKFGNSNHSVLVRKKRGGLEENIQIQNRQTQKREEERIKSAKTKNLELLKKAVLPKHTGTNFLTMLVTRARANSSKNHTLLMCRI